MDSAAIDQAISQLQDCKAVWAQLPIPKKLDLLRNLRTRVNDVSQRWVNAAVKAKGIPEDSRYVGEEWLSGPWALLHGINGNIAALTANQKGETRKPKSVRIRPNGQVVVDVFPLDMLDRAVVNGVRSEVWMQKDITLANWQENIGAFYKQENPPGKVALVLGAGNIASITPLDVLFKLYVEGQVCILKMNPINDYLGPFLEEIFKQFVDAGFLRFAYGSEDVGKYLTQHAGVEEIHLTGSVRTHDAIVFGADDEAEQRKQRNESVTDKRVTSELGAVCPTIVVPGPWSDADIRYQAEHIASQKLHNSGYNCIAVQVLIMPENWERSDDLLNAISDVMRSVPTRAPYYPKSAERQQCAIAGHEHVDLLDSEEVPRTIVSSLDPENADEVNFTTEAFCNVLAETRLPGATPADYLKNAVKFANDKLWGTLGANIIIHPKTAKHYARELEEAIADLRYGGIAVNTWVAAAYLISQNSWGAYPGHTAQDIQSGVGVVHNTFLFDKPQKSVVYGPFYPYPRNLLHGEWHMSPKPAWFVTKKTARILGKRFARYEADRGWKRLPGLVIPALRR
jgi:aldehyde dehydrogenase (NAD(P)+)